MSKSKAQKQVERRHRIERERNMRLNKPKPDYILYAKVEGGWKAAMTFKTLAEVNAHVATMEEMRKKNSTDIIEAKVIEVKTRREIRHIEGHELKDPAILTTKPEAGNPAEKTV
jgi:hypothetical protein